MYKKSKKTIIIFLFISLSQISHASILMLPDGYNTSLSGFVSGLPFVTFEKIDDLYFSNLLQARADFGYYPADWLTLEFGGRLQILTGDQVVGPQSALIDYLEEDVGYLNLTRSWQAIMIGNIDRAFLSYSIRRLRITLGRQRINWGTNFVWNPNDWFNAFEYLDFDYEERPGSDALRIQYFTGALSVLELALKAGRERDERTYALMYRYNYEDYDLQFQGGVFGEDLALGFSWAGSISGGGFRGEISSYYPVLDRDQGSTDKLTFVASVSGDYTLTNGLRILSEALYNGFGNGEYIDTIPLFSRELSAKSLSPARFLLHGSLSYPFNLLLSGSLSLMLNPEDLSFLTIPSIEWSVLTNLDFLILAQFYYGDSDDVFGALPNLLALRFKWSF